MTYQGEIIATVTNGFPVLVRYTYTHLPMIRNVRPNESEIDYTILTLRGQSAWFIESKMTDADHDKLEELIVKDIGL